MIFVSKSLKGFKTIEEESTEMIDDNSELTEAIQTDELNDKKEAVSENVSEHYGAENDDKVFIVDANDEDQNERAENEIEAAIHEEPAKTVPILNCEDVNDQEPPLADDAVCDRSAVKNDKNDIVEFVDDCKLQNVVLKDDVLESNANKTNEKQVTDESVVEVSEELPESVPDEVVEDSTVNATQGVSGNEVDTQPLKDHEAPEKLNNAEQCATDDICENITNEIAEIVAEVVAEDVAQKITKEVTVEVTEVVDDIVYQITEEATEDAAVTGPKDEKDEKNIEDEIQSIEPVLTDCETATTSSENDSSVFNKLEKDSIAPIAQSTPKSPMFMDDSLGVLTEVRTVDASELTHLVDSPETDIKTRMTSTVTSHQMPDKLLDSTGVSASPSADLTDQTGSGGSEDRDVAIPNDSGNDSFATDKTSGQNEDSCDITPVAEAEKIAILDSQNILNVSNDISPTEMSEKSPVDSESNMTDTVSAVTVVTLNEQVLDDDKVDSGITDIVGNDDHDPASVIDNEITQSKTDEKVYRETTQESFEKDAEQTTEENAEESADKEFMATVVESKSKDVAKDVDTEVVEDVVNPGVVEDAVDAEVVENVDTEVVEDVIDTEVVEDAVDTEVVGNVDTEVVENVIDTEVVEDAVDTGVVEDAFNVQVVKDVGTEVVEDVIDTELIEDTVDTEVVEDAVDTEVAEDAVDTEVVEDALDTEVIGTVDTDVVKDVIDTEVVDDAVDAEEKAENAEENTDSESKAVVDDVVDTEVVEDAVDAAVVEDAVDTEDVSDTKVVDDAVKTEAVEGVVETEVVEDAVDAEIVKDAVDSKDVTDTKVVDDAVKTEVVEDVVDTEVVEDAVDAEIVEDAVDTKEAENIVDTKVAENVVDTELVDDVVDAGVVEDVEVLTNEENEIEGIYDHSLTVEDVNKAIAVTVTQNSDEDRVVVEEDESQVQNEDQEHDSEIHNSNHSFESEQNSPKDIESIGDSHEAHEQCVEEAVIESQVEDVIGVAVELSASETKNVTDVSNDGPKDSITEDDDDTVVIVPQNESECITNSESYEMVDRVSALEESPNDTNEEFVITNGTDEVTSITANNNDIRATCQSAATTSTTTVDDITIVDDVSTISDDDTIVPEVDNSADVTDDVTENSFGLTESITVIDENSVVNVQQTGETLEARPADDTAITTDSGVDKIASIDGSKADTIFGDNIEKFDDVEYSRLEQSDMIGN